jgi:hypothetical protein
MTSIERRDSSQKGRHLDPEKIHVWINWRMSGRRCWTKARINKSLPDSLNTGVDLLAIKELVAGNDALTMVLK